LSAVDLERQRKSKEFIAYSSQLFKSQRNRELAYYQDKIAYLSERLTQIAVDASRAPEADRSKAETLEEVIRQKRDRAASRLNALRQQIRGKEPVAL